MKKYKFGFALSLVLAAGTILGACGASEDTNEEPQTSGEGEGTEEAFSVAMVTDVGGVDDRSFNQSAWEGLQEFGAQNGLEQGANGYDYLQSQSEADYRTNLNTAVRNGYDLVFGIGFLLEQSIGEVAAQQPEGKFALVDSVAEGDNIANITFSEHEGSFLVGVAAGLTTETNKIGFVGGVESDLINKFAAGFKAGVEAVNPDATVDIQFAGDFNKADIGQQIASAMYGSGVDVIYHAAGGTGNGVFTEAKNLKQQDPDRQIFVIGVDRDQSAEGVVTIDGEDVNITLTSMIKRVDNAVIDISTRTMNGDFPGGEIVEYGLSDDGVGIAPTQDNLSDDILAEIEEWREKIINGEVDVPSTL